MHRHKKCAHFLWSYPPHDSSNRTDFVRGPDLSPFEDVFWGQMGGGGYPPGMASVLMSGEDQVAGVDAGPGFGNAAIVYLDLVRSAGEDDARGGARPAGD